MERAVNALFKICQQHAGDNVLVVSHGALISSVLSALTGESDPQVANGTYRELDAHAEQLRVPRTTEPLKATALNKSAGWSGDQPSDLFARRFYHQDESVTVTTGCPVLQSMLPVKLRSISSST